MRRGRSTDVVLLTVAAWLLFVPGASAYIDAGSASVLFQGIVAVLAASAMTLKLYWRRIRSWASRGDETGAADRSASATTLDEA